MKARVALIVCAGMIAISRPVASQVIELYTPTEAVSPGTAFDLHLVAHYPESSDIIVPRPDSDGPAQWGDFVLVSLEDRHIVRDAQGFVRDSLVFRAAVFVVDSARTAPAFIDFVTPDDTMAIAIPARVIPVMTTVPPGAEPRDISPIISAPARIWLYALILVAVALLAWLAKHMYRRRGAGEGDARQRRMSPIEEAIYALDDLAGDSPPEQDRVFVIRLSDILRQYIARGLSTPALERTSAELLRDLPAYTDLPSSMTERLRPILHGIDEIKFAAAPMTAPRTLLLAQVRTWISEADAAVQPDEPATTPVLSS